MWLECNYMAQEAVADLINGINEEYGNIIPSSGRSPDLEAALSAYGRAVVNKEGTLDQQADLVDEAHNNVISKANAAAADKKLVCNPVELKINLAMLRILESQTSSEGGGIQHGGGWAENMRDVKKAILMSIARCGRAVSRGVNAGFTVVAGFFDAGIAQRRRDAAAAAAAAPPPVDSVLEAEGRAIAYEGLVIAAVAGIGYGAFDTPIAVLRAWMTTAFMNNLVAIPGTIATVLGRLISLAGLGLATAGLTTLGALQYMALRATAEQTVNVGMAIPAASSALASITRDAIASSIVGACAGLTPATVREAWGAARRSFQAAMDDPVVRPELDAAAAGAGAAAAGAGAGAAAAGAGAAAAAPPAPGAIEEGSRAAAAAAAAAATATAKAAANLAIVAVRKLTEIPGEISAGVMNAAKAIVTAAASKWHERAMGGLGQLQTDQLFGDVSRDIQNYVPDAGVVREALRVASAPPAGAGADRSPEVQSAVVAAAEAVPLEANAVAVADAVAGAEGDEEVEEMAASAAAGSGAAASAAAVAMPVDAAAGSGAASKRSRPAAAAEERDEGEARRKRQAAEDEDEEDDAELGGGHRCPKCGSDMVDRALGVQKPKRKTRRAAPKKVKKSKKSKTSKKGGSYRKNRKMSEKRRR